MIVVDTNVIAYALIQGAQTKNALNVYQKDSDWLVSELWRHEFLNVLALYVRQGGIDAADGRQTWRAATSLFDSSIRPVPMEDALQIAVDESVSSYDAQFVALAYSLQIQLVTEDRGLQRKFPGTAVSMRNFLAA